MLRDRSRSFVIKRIAQSDSRPGAMNTLSVTLLSTVSLTHIVPAAHITIFGLTGARSPNGNGPLQLAGPSIEHFDSGPAAVGCEQTSVGCGGATWGLWDDVMKSLTLRITDKGFTAGTLYEFKFTIQNPWNPILQPAQDVYVGMQIGTYTVQSKMTNALGQNNENLGTYDPSAAMFVEQTRFAREGDTFENVTSIWQSTMSPNALNTITLVFETNVELVPGAIVYVSGMRGYDATVNSQTSGAASTISVKMDTTTSLISVASSNVLRILPDKFVDPVYMRIDDEVTRIGACQTGLAVCVYDPDDNQGNIKEQTARDRSALRYAGTA